MMIMAFLQGAAGESVFVVFLDLVDTSAVGLAERVFPLSTGCLTECQDDMTSRVWYGMFISVWCSSIR